MRLEPLESRDTPGSQTLFALSQDGSSIVATHQAAGPVGVGGAPGSIDGSARFLSRVDAYPGVPGGVRVAVGDVTGDGFEDLVTVPGPGTSVGQKVDVKIFDGSALLNGQVKLVRTIPDVFGGFTGGAYVAVGQVDPVSFAKEIIVGAGSGGGPRVLVLNANGSVFRDFLAYAPGFTGGVRVASVDCNGDTRDDIITAAGPGGGPHVKIFDGFLNNFLIDEFFAYDATFLGGVYVAAGELDGVATRKDIVTGAGEGGGPHVKVWCAGLGQRYFTKAEAFVAEATNTNGVRVGVSNLDLRTNRQSIYTGDGALWANNVVPSINVDPRLRSFRVDDFVFGVPVPPGNVAAKSRLTEERISLFDGLSPGRAGGLFINV